MFDRFRNGNKPQPEAPVPGQPTPENPPEATEPTAVEPTPEPAEIPTKIVRYNTYDEGPLYDALATSDKTYDLIDTRLPLPAGDMQLHASVKDERLSLYGTVQLEDKDHAKAILKKVIKTARQQAAENDGEIEEYRDAIQVTTPDGSDILIARGDYYGQDNCIVVSTGKVRSGYDTFTELFEGPQLTPEVFKNTLTHTLGALALVVDTAYAATYRTRPRDIKLRIPERPQEATAHEAESSTPIVADLNEQPSNERSSVSLNDIGGQPKAKEEIRSLAYGLSHPEVYKRWGTRLPKGVLFEGPPGTGKTLLAKALATETDAAFFSVSASDVTSKWYGEAEKRIKKIFEQAAEAPRAVIYLDEIDALTPSRGGDSHEATKRVVSVILQHMDGMSAKDNVLVIASTNRAQDMDSAILRPGRFDQKIYVGLPDADGRKSIFDIHLQRARTIAERDIFAADVDPSALADHADDLSGADIAEIVRRTLEHKVREETLTQQNASVVSMDDLLRQVNEYTEAKRRTDTQ